MSFCVHKFLYTGGCKLFKHVYRHRSKFNPLLLFLAQRQVHSNMCATRRSSNVSLTHEFSLTLIWYCHIASRRTEESTVVGNSSGNQGLDSQQYDIDIIKAATNYFDHGNKLGEGGFGPVYKVLFMFSLRLLF